MSWAEVFKAVNKNLDYPANRQHRIYRRYEFMASETFVAPQTGVYLITCIGQGGNGGSSRATSSNSNSAGGSGGSGAIAKSKLLLTKDTSIEITVTEAISSFGNYLSATCGGNGEHASPGSTGTGGLGGVATGGNIINLNGNDGVTGTPYNYAAAGVNKGADTPIITPQATNYETGAFQDCVGGSGYSISLVSSKHVTTRLDNTPLIGENGAGSSNGGNWTGDRYATAVIQGNGGGAFGGGASCTRIYDGSATSYIYSPCGGCGAVIIEYLEEIFF